MKLTPYPEYKDSGVPWLGKIPAHWETKRIKNLFDERVQKGYPDEVMLAATQKKGVIPKEMFENRTVVALKNLHLLKLVEIDDFVISLRSFQGGIERAYFRGIISPAYTIITPKKEIEPDFFKYLGKSKVFLGLLKNCVTGIREGQNIDYEVLRRSYIPKPQIKEQAQIARFLDWKISRINKFIRNKKRLIELLKEQKQVIINRAVTRGLNPDAKLKPSGIDWLGEIPEHWELTKIKFASKMITGGATPASSRKEFWNGNIIWVTPQDVSRSESLTSSIRKITHSGYASCSTVLVPPGSVIFTSRAPVGNVSIAKVELCTNQGCKAIVSDEERMLSKYCFIILKLMKPEFAKISTGTTFLEISTRTFENTKIPLPPIEEQHKIINHIATATQPIHQTIARAEQEIALITEYKERLISDVVTGKVDVRGVKVPEISDDDLLPPYDEEAENDHLPNNDEDEEQDF